MEFFSEIIDLFKNDYTKAIDEVKKKRKEDKQKLINELKEKCYMTDEEIAQVTTVIDECMEKIDKLQNNYDFSVQDIRIGERYNIELVNIQKELEGKLKEKIKEIMDKKLEEAKKYYMPEDTTKTE